MLKSNNKNDVFFNANIFPNPSSGIIYLNGIDEQTNYSVKTYHLFGKEISAFIKKDSKTFDFSGFSAGVYIIKLIDNNSGFSKQFKIVIAK